MAAALTVPAMTVEGHVVGQRDAVVFITAVVIVHTLTLLGPALPAVVRRARFPQDEAKTAELALTRCHMSSAALRALPELAQQFGIPEADTLRMVQDIEDRTAPAPATEIGPSSCRPAAYARSLSRSPRPPERCLPHSCRRRQRAIHAGVHRCSYGPLPWRQRRSCSAPAGRPVKGHLPVPRAAPRSLRA